MSVTELTAERLTELRAFADKYTDPSMGFGSGVSVNVRATELVTLLAAAEENAALRARVDQVKELIDAQTCFDKLGADRMADEIAALVTRRVIDSRSAAADAQLDYRNPPRTPMSDRLAKQDERIATLEAELAAALHITDARPLDLTYTDARTGLPAGAVHESNPGEPKLCDDCNQAWKEADPLYRSMVGLPPLG